MDPDVVSLLDRREVMVWQIRESRALMLELATLPAEMALLAAQQVNEVRLSLLETPKDIGWGEVAWEFALAFAVNTSFVEKLAARLFRRTFGRLMGCQLALRTLPKSAIGAQLAGLVERLEQKQARRVADAVRQAASAAGSVKLPSKLPSLIEAEKLLARELASYAKVEVKAEDLALYAKSINELMESKNAAALVKATNAARGRGAPRKAQPLATEDGATVAVMEHFMCAARAQRIHIESLHNRFELLARTFPLASETYASLYAAFDTQSILDSESELIRLDELGSGLRLRYEALIWAVHLGFSRERKAPPWQEAAVPGSRVFPSLSEKLERYLLGRFGGLVVLHREVRGQLNIDWSRDTPGTKGLHLQEYFWDITDTLQQG